MIYPLDYGYLEITTSSDGGGIDVWFGSLNMVIDNQSAKH
jgi:inorganic pyrophosphatase